MKKFKNNNVYHSQFTWSSKTGHDYLVLKRKEKLIKLKTPADTVLIRKIKIVNGIETIKISKNEFII